MSNRSFVFTANDYRQVPVNAVGLSEYEYQVHPLYLLLVAFNSDVISSGIFNDEDQDAEKTAMVGGFEQGKALVLKFLELVSIYSKSYRSKSFSEFVATSREFLNQRNEKYVVLECAEIIQLGDTNFVSKMIAEMEEMKNEVEALYAKHLKGEAKKEDLAKMPFYNEFDDICTYHCQIEVEDIEWEDFWTDTVYYNLGE